MAVVGKGTQFCRVGKFVCTVSSRGSDGFHSHHVLSQLSLKISVLLQWAWLFLTGQRGRGSS